MKPWKPKPSDFPKGTLLGDYIEYMSQFETAFTYDVWCGLWLLSNACMREIHVDRPGAPVYLNMYLILAAESGITRKSSAVRSARDVLRCFHRSLSRVPIFIENKTTPEALLYRLSESGLVSNSGEAVMAISEMVTFFGREKYSKAMPGVLTDLYDCPAARSGGGTLKSGEVYLRNVWINLITASTPTWLVGAINPDIIEGGFTSRAYFVVDEARKDAIAWPKTTSAITPDSIAKRMEDIYAKARYHKTIGIDDRALQAFTKWYKGRYIFRDPYRASFDSREDAHVLRIAALLSINDGRFLINKSDIDYAIKLVHAVKEAGAGLFEGTGSNTQRIIGIDRLRDILLSIGKGYIRRSELSVKVKRWLKAEELQAVLDIMFELGMIQKFELTQTRGRPTEVYRATKMLAARTSVTDVMAQLLD